MGVFFHSFPTNRKSSSFCVGKFPPASLLSKVSVCLYLSLYSIIKQFNTRNCDFRKFYESNLGQVHH